MGIPLRPIIHKSEVNFVLNLHFYTWLGISKNHIVIFRAKIKNRKRSLNRYQKCLIYKNFRLKIQYLLKTYYSQEWVFFYLLFFSMSLIKNINKNVRENKQFLFYFIYFHSSSVTILWKRNKYKSRGTLPFLRDIANPNKS